MSHTPGPWVPISVTGGWDGVAENANRNSIICNLSLNNPDNMYLIAAAPELLKALKGILAKYFLPDEETIPEAVAAKAAIAKAEGLDLAAQIVRVLEVEE